MNFIFDVWLAQTQEINTLKHIKQEFVHKTELITETMKAATKTIYLFEENVFSFIKMYLYEQTVRKIDIEMYSQLCIFLIYCFT